MYYGAIKDCDIANGPGIRVSLFVSGCRNHCEGCFSEQTWDFEYGLHYKEETELKILQALAPDYVEGFTVLGGEPLEPENQPVVLSLIQRIRRELPNKTIWMYTGFTWEHLRNSRAYTDILWELLSLVDVLVEGPFVLKERNLSLAFRGSNNQRILDVKKSMQEEIPVTLSF